MAVYMDTNRYLESAKNHFEKALKDLEKSVSSETSGSEDYKLEYVRMVHEIIYNIKKSLLEL